MVSKLIPQYEAQIIFLAFFIKIHEEVESELKKNRLLLSSLVPLIYGPLDLYIIKSYCLGLSEDQRISLRCSITGT